MKKLTVWIGALLLVGGSVIPALADSESSVGSDSTTENGSVDFYADDYGLSSTIANDYFLASSSFSQAFSFNLPSLGASAGILDSATLDLSTSGSTSGAVPSSIYSSGAVDPGYYYTYQYACGTYACNCGWFGCDTCTEYCTGSAFQSYSWNAPSPSFTQSASASFSTITASDGTTESLPANGGLIDLIALGLGPEVLAGDSFTVTGTRTLQLFNVGFFDSGYNGYSYSSVSGQNAITASGTLDAEFSTVPEPASVLLFGSLLCVAFWMRRKTVARN